MIVKNENIDIWIGRAFILISFFLMLSLANNSFGSSSHCKDISYEQVVNINSSAILFESNSTPDYIHSFEYCICFYIESWKDNFNLVNYNKIVSRQIKTEEVRFNEFKPKLLRLLVSYLQYLSIEDYLLIS
jgi:hypothetical protein